MILHQADRSTLDNPLHVEVPFAPGTFRVLTSTHVDRLFEVYDSTEEAINSFLTPKLLLGDISCP